MKEKTGKKSWLLFFIIGVLILGMGVFSRILTAQGASSVEGRVLFISSYSYGWDTVQMQIEGLKSVLTGEVVLDYEFMDTKRVNDETAMKLFYEGLKYRLSKVEPYDVVIVGDDAALIFAMAYREELFAGIPIVFEGINDENLALQASEDPLITGVLEKLSVEKNVDLGLTLIPDAKQVVAVLDDTVTGQAERARFYSCADKYPELEFTEINTSALTTEELRSALRTIKQDSVLIYITMTEDASGKQYTNQESVKMISIMAGVPALRMVEGGIGEGLLGGNIVSMQKSGEIAAGMALRFMRGVDVESIVVEADTPNMYYVDEQVMRKFKLDMSLLPKETIIINHKETFWERNHEAIVPSIVIVLLLGGVMVWLYVDNLRRRRLMGELEEARSIMESASQHDFLTGLSNRNKFMKDLEKATSGENPCTVFMIDIDDFKHINDTYGHTAGDDALKQIADRLKALGSQILTAYRFAGDEFIIILRSNQGKIVEKTAYACRNLFGKPCVLNGQKYAVGGSIGIATYPDDTTDMEELIVFADDAMYRVKKSGKNDFAFYSGKPSSAHTKQE